jgi:hypothetical protein
VTEYTEEQEAFCNANCYWMEHHPDCVRFIDGIDDCPHGAGYGCKECYEKEATDTGEKHMSIEAIRKALAVLETRYFLEHQDEMISEAIEILRKGFAETNKEWVSLTEEEANSIEPYCDSHVLFSDAIFAKLMEKNT